MPVNGLSTQRRIPAYAVLAVLAVAAAVAVFLHASAARAQEGEQPTVTVTFASSTIADKTYTAGTKVNLGLSQDEIPKLPEVTSVNDTHEDALGHTVTYSISGLPAGLTMDDGEASDRIIWGAPESATTNPVTVTYTATVIPVRRQGTGFSEGDPVEASITFQVTVNPAVSWNAEAQKFFKSRIIAYVPGSGWTATTFPEAQGGTGTLTYSLIHNATDLPLADHVSSITFDASTRTIGGTVASGERYAVTFIATDQNGAVAKGYTEVRHGIGGL